MAGDTASRLLRAWAGLLSLVAAGIHMAVTPEHLQEWWGYGAFFIIASTAQTLYALILLAVPRTTNWAGHVWTQWQRRLYWAGIAGNGAIIALWAVTRTVGIPLLGPAAGRVETVGRLDAASKVVEGLLIFALLGLLRLLPRGTRHAAEPGPRPAMAAR